LALSAIRRKSPLIYGATFHTQQCIEKYLKALLTSRKVSFPRTHDLAALSALCQQNGIILPISDDNLDLLSTYAVEARYPGNLPTIDDAKIAFNIARAFRKYIRKTLSIKS
jgi:HEPN domain-containing protein